MPTAAKTKAPGREWRSLADEALAGSGLRSGGARREVVELLSRQRCFLSAQEIHERLRDSGSRVGIASVYRALEALQGLGLVQRTDLGEGPGLYEPVVPDGDHHHHLVCERCGRITPFEDERLERAIHDLADARRHTAVAHEVMIMGTCSTCSRPARRRAA